MSKDASLEACAFCYGTGVDGDVGRDGTPIDIPCSACNGSGKVYLSKCKDGLRCLHGCRTNEGCFHEAMQGGQQ